MPAGFTVNINMKVLFFKLAIFRTSSKLAKVYSILISLDILNLKCVLGYSTDGHVDETIKKRATSLCYNYSSLVNIATLLVRKMHTLQTA